MVREREVPLRPAFFELCLGPSGSFVLEIQGSGLLVLLLPGPCMARSCGRLCTHTHTHNLQQLPQLGIEEVPDWMGGACEVLVVVSVVPLLAYHFIVDTRT